MTKHQWHSHYVRLEHWTEFDECAKAMEASGKYQRIKLGRSDCIEHVATGAIVGFSAELGMQMSMTSRQEVMEEGFFIAPRIAAWWRSRKAA